MLRRIFVLAGAAVILIGGIVTTAHASTMTDAQIKVAVEKQMQRDVYFTVFDDVQGTIDNGVVTLTGHVTEPFKASEMAKLVKRVDGVREVDNKIQTLPVSSFDDRLRVSIARAIYRDPNFWNYGIQANPPIHVIVNNGHVTLTGVVNSNFDKVVVESIARGAEGAFSVKNELKTDKEMRN